MHIPEQLVIRPPSEAQSLLVRVVRGCHWNRCNFCGIYDLFGVPHSTRSLREVLMDIENDSIVRGTVENQGDETEVSDEESERELDAAEVGFTSLSEEEYAELQKDDD